MSAPRLTGRQWKAACEDLRRVASDIQRAAEPHLGMGNHFERFREEIAREEKGHRRFAPAGYKHRLPIARAVDYFVVKTIAEAMAADLDEPVKALEGMREDYIRARVFCANVKVREAIEVRCGIQLRHLAETLDYCDLEGAP